MDLQYQVYEVFLALHIFSFFISADMLLLTPLVATILLAISFGCDIFSGCVLVWICNWFAKILVVLKSSWHFGDYSLTFLLMVEFDCQFHDSVIVPPPSPHSLRNLPSGNLLILLLMVIYC